MTKISPTQLTLRKLREDGYIAQVVEYWNPHAKIRQDLFGVIDVLAAHPSEGILGVQATSDSHHAARRMKAQESEHLPTWIQAGGRFEVWSWAKKWRTDRTTHCNHSLRCGCVWVPRTEGFVVPSQERLDKDLMVWNRPDLEYQLKERAKNERQLGSEDPERRGTVTCAGPVCSREAREGYHFCSPGCRDSWVRANA